MFHAPTSYTSGFSASWEYRTWIGKLVHLPNVFLPLFIHVPGKIQFSPTTPPITILIIFPCFPIYGSPKLIFRSHTELIFYVFHLLFHLFFLNRDLSALPTLHWPISRTRARIYPGPVANRLDTSWWVHQTTHLCYPTSTSWVTCVQIDLSMYSCTPIQSSQFQYSRLYILILTLCHASLCIKSMLFHPSPCLTVFGLTFITKIEFSRWNDDQHDRRITQEPHFLCPNMPYSPSVLMYYLCFEKVWTQTVIILTPGLLPELLSHTYSIFTWIPIGQLPQ